MSDPRVPPQDLDAERCVIGSALLINDCLDDITLRSDDFYSGAHQKLWQTITSMWSGGCRAIDAATLGAELHTAAILEDAGGLVYLAEVLESVPHAAHVRHYAKIVLSKSKQRQIIYTATQAVSDAYDGGDPDEIITQLDTSLLAMREASSVGDIVTMGQAVDALEEQERNPASVHSTGLIDLDRQIRGGLRGGQFVIAGGRPGSGKSVLTGQIAKTFAECGEPSLIVSLEMDRSELAERFDKSVDRLELRELPVYLVDSAFDAGRIAGLIRVAKRRHNIQIAVLDYLQLTESEDRKASRERQVAEVSRMLKRLAGELKIPIVAACQLNRSSTKEQREPRLSDLRESGSLEQDADIVVLLHQDDDNGAKAIVAKHRNGCTGIVPLTFHGSEFRFSNGTPEPYYQGSM